MLNREIKYNINDDTEMVKMAQKDANESLFRQVGNLCLDGGKRYAIKYYASTTRTTSDNFETYTIRAEIKEINEETYIYSAIPAKRLTFWQRLKYLFKGK